MFKNDFNAEASIRFWAKFTRICVLIISIICAFLTPLLFASDFRSIGQTALAIGVGAFLLGLPTSSLMWGFADVVRKANQDTETADTPEISLPFSFAKQRDLRTFTGPDRYTADECIAPFAFEKQMDLKTFTVPDGVKKIDFGAFFKCTNLTSVTLPATIEHISNEAFYNCTSLTHIVFKGTVSAWNDLVCKDRDWHTGVPATEVICSDGTAKLD